ncbi:hypothetical protein MMC10_006669 [Thelotrema lepadinum]|nr:hypothetical protein [Thelotrema lepadinum]
MPGNIDDVAIGAKHDIALALGPDMQHRKGSVAHEVELPPVYEGKGTLTTTMIGDDFPTEEELATLHRVADKIPIKAFTIAFVEGCERLSFYGTTAVFTNFIQRAIPDGSLTGAVPDAANNPDQSPGVLGMGQRAAAGITTFNQFWVYLIPLFGAYVADSYLGRYNTILISILIALVGHVILTASAAPMVITNQPGSLGAFLVGLIIMGIGTGGFKPNISPLVAEQLPHTTMRVITTKKGERVIVDPAVTSSRVYMYFYLAINVGSLVGQIAMSYAERYVGFWLSYMIPTLTFCLCPLVMYGCRNMYKRTPPQGSVLGKAMRLWIYAQKGRWSLNPFTTHKRLHDGTFWSSVRPSAIPAAQRPSWMTFDDAWVDEVGRGFAACSVFLWLPLYWLTYNQLNNNLTSQAATMTLNGIPNDVLSNLDPFALIILIPVFDGLIYPGLRKMGINFTPVKKIALGFFTGTAAMVWAAVLQQYIYWQSDCGYDAGECDTVVSINVWAQTGAYVLIAISEIFASITSLEYAFSKAPRNMRSLVMSFNLFMSAISAALGEAFVYLANDPLLVWNYGVSAVLSFIGGCCFWYMYRQLDRDEDKLNMLPTGHLGTESEAREIEHGMLGREDSGSGTGSMEKKEVEG